MIDAAENLLAGYFSGDLFWPNVLETEVIDAEDVLSLFVDNKFFVGHVPICRHYEDNFYMVDRLEIDD